MQVETIHIATEVSDVFSAGEAWDYRLVPYEASGEILSCYGERERDYTAVAEEIEVLTGRQLEISPVESGLLTRLLNRCYRGGGEKNAVRPAVKLNSGGNQRFLHELIGDSFQNYASDIHFEPYEEYCRVRFRIDGKLIERHMIEKGSYASLVNQVKILANLDISEKRLPQDGRISYHCDGNRFDVRVSTLPTIHGEKVVLRLLTRHAELLELGNLGFDEKQLSDYLSAVRRPHGLVLVSGPTGSGKSTTLYATLRLLNEKSCNILTIEDPVEYTLGGVNQVQLKEEIGLTFAGALRTFLRQDPDIIMLGEIRDPDTAQMAVRSSLTGHLVFSTIHTNSAWGCVSRLTDMNIHPYLISDTLLLCAAQRLVRLLCPACKREIAVPENFPGGGRTEGKKLFAAAGCEACYYTGYSGRKAIYEVIPMDAGLVELIRDSGGDVLPYLKKRNIRTLQDAAFELMSEGKTSPEEVLPLLDETAPAV